MHEAELLYLVAVLIYVYEGLIILPTTDLVVQRAWRRWRRVDPLVLRSGRGPAVAIGAILPPLGPTLPVAARGSLDATAVREAVALTTRATRHLRFLENLLFFGLFGGGAALVWLDNAPNMAILVAVLGGWVLSVGASLLARRRLPQAQRPPWKELVIAALSPLSALRLHDLFFKRACDGADITAVLVALAPPDVAREAMRVALARARYTDDGPLAELEAFARTEAFDLAALDAEPMRDRLESLAFCPVCHALYSRINARCSTCRDVPVHSFAAAQ